MPQLIIGLILILLAIVLAVIAVAVVIVAIPGWAAGTMLGGIVLLLTYQARIARLTSRENLGAAVFFSINGSRVHWHLKDTGDASSKQLDPEVVLCALLGAACAGVVGYFLYLQARQPDKWLFQVAIVVSALAVPWCIVKLKPRKIYERWLRSRVSRVMGAFDSTLAGIDELRELEASVGSLAGQLRIAFPADYATEVEQHVNSHQVELVFERAAFSQFMDARLQSARKDNEELERGLRTIQEMENLYLQTAHEVNRTNSISMITESDWLGAGLKPENLPTLLSARKWDEFHNAVALMRDDMIALKEKARKRGEQPDDATETQFESNKMTKDKAMDILGVSGDVCIAEIQKLRKEFAKIYHSDRRQTSGAQTREAAAKRHADINAACDFLEDELHAKR